jgi:hypothetical protein
MSGHRLDTQRLVLFPLDPVAAGALPQDRPKAAGIIGFELSPDWPGPDLLDVLPMQADAPPEQAQ